MSATENACASSGSLSWAYLNIEGRKRFFVAYERRMEREFTSEQHGSRTSLRRELHNQCRAVKKAVSEAEPFEPFLMN
jgi:hypothetical protein